MYFFICWQITEFLFQYIFFQNVLADLFASYRGDPSGQFKEAYAVMGLIRYSVISIFLITLYSGLNRTKEPSERPSLDWKGKDFNKLEWSNEFAIFIWHANANHIPICAA